MDNRKLLIIEDDPDDASLTEMAVAPALPGYSWTVAHDGVEGLDALLAPGAEQPSLVILDLNLPRMDGLQLLEKLNAAWGPGLRGLKVAVLSSSNEETDRRRAKELGASIYIRKPINAAETSAMVAALAALANHKGDA